MDRPKLLSLAISLCLAGVLSGCGSSGQSPSPPSPLQITTQSPLRSGRVNVSYNTTFTATGGVPPYSWSASDVPPGLVMSTVGTLSGTPSQAGSFTPTASVSDSEQRTATGNFSITLAAPLKITTTSLPTSSPGIFYSATLAATGGFPPYSWTITQGALPSGLTLNATSGLISGTATNAGTAGFTVQVSDNGTPVASVTANLSIAINPPPARDAALYTTDSPAAAYRIPSDGSLTLLPSSPESVVPYGSSPTLPLLFTVVQPSGYGQNPPSFVESILVNPDYSLTLYSSSASLPSTNDLLPPSVDPTGSNLYLAGYIDNNQTTGVFIYPANGSLQLLGSIAVPNLNPRYAVMVFTPGGTLAFIPTYETSGPGSILSYARASDGTLTLAATYTLPGASSALGLAVSPEGRYLAEWDNQGNGGVQVFSIATDGTLTPATPPFTVTYDPQGDAVGVSDMTWDSSGSFLLPATSYLYSFGSLRGGVAVLSFTGSSLTETVYPMGSAVDFIQRAGSFVYAHETCRGSICPTVDGFDFQNGQLTPLPGSPWTENGTTLSGVMVIY